MQLPPHAAVLHPTAWQNFCLCSKICVLAHASIRTETRRRSGINSSTSVISGDTPASLAHPAILRTAAWVEWRVYDHGTCPASTAGNGRVAASMASRGSSPATPARRQTTWTRWGCVLWKNKVPRELTRPSEWRDYGSPRRDRVHSRRTDSTSSPAAATADDDDDAAPLPRLLQHVHQEPAPLRGLPGPVRSGRWRG